MAQNPNFFGEVYVHTCLPNGKSYVGQTTAGVSKRWKLHLRCARSPKTLAYGNLFSKALRKYGADAFESQTLSVAHSQMELDNLERVWIILLQTKAPSGYNLATGGYAAAGHEVSPKVRARLSAATIEQWKSSEFRQHYSAVRRGIKQPKAAVEARAAHLRGRKQSADMVAKRVAKTTGLKRTQDFRDACAARMQGTHRSAETRRRMSLAQKARQERGRTNG